MLAKFSGLSLPPELIFTIIESLITPSDARKVLPSSHSVTKTLLSLARASSITYPVARRLLFTHCLWIDDAERLRCLEISVADSLEPQPENNAPTRMRSYVPIIDHITSLYICLSIHDLAFDQPSITQLFDLCTAIAPHLRRLVVDIPLKECWTGHHPRSLHSLNQIRRAFTGLTALESFCSVQDELCLPAQCLDTAFQSELSVGDYCVWSAWPNLKTLALFGQNIAFIPFFANLGRLKQLHTLVLTKAVGLSDCEMKGQWKEHGENRVLDIILVNVECSHETPLGGERWKKDNVSVRKLDVPTSYYGDEDEVVLCQEWVKRRMLSAEEPAQWH